MVDAGYLPGCFLEHLVGTLGEAKEGRLLPH